MTDVVDKKKRPVAPFVAAAVVFCGVGDGRTW
jgi:hypothetical protein